MGKPSKKSATKVEADPAMIKATKPLKKGKREREDDLETKVNLKKQKKDQKKKSENKDTVKGFTDFLQLIEAKVDLLTTKVDLLTSKVDLLATNADLREILTSAKEVAETKIPDAAAKNGSLESSSSEDESSSDEESSKESEDDSSSSEDESEDDSQDEKKAASSSDSADKDSDKVAAERGKIAAYTPQNSVQTIYVEGFGSSLPEDDIKTALSKHFSTCGEITRVFVATNLETGAVKGFAYIDLKEGAKKALELNGSDMIGKKLVVKTALLPRDSYPGYSGSNLGFGGRFGGRFGFVGGRFAGGRCGGLGRCCGC